MGPILYCGPSACVVWLRPESDGKQQESPCYFQSTFCLLSVCLFLFTHILSHWWLGCGQGDSQSPSFLSPASSSGPVKNSLVILGFRSFVVGPQFKTTFFFFSFFHPSFHKDVFWNLTHIKQNCPNFHFVLSMPLLRLCQWRFLQSKFLQSDIPVYK